MDAKIRARFQIEPINKGNKFPAKLFLVQNIRVSYVLTVDSDEELQKIMSRRDVIVNVDGKKIQKIEINKDDLK